MRKIGDLMNDLGFNKDASFEAKKAFIQHLVRVAENPKLRAVQPVEPIAQPQSPAQQLSFDPDLLGEAPTGTSRR